MSLFYDDNKNNVIALNDFKAHCPQSSPYTSAQNAGLKQGISVAIFCPVNQYKISSKHYLENDQVDVCRRV